MKGQSSTLLGVQVQKQRWPVTLVADADHNRQAEMPVAVNGHEPDVPTEPVLVLQNVALTQRLLKSRDSMEVHCKIFKGSN